MTVSTSWSKQIVHSPFLPAGGGSEPETLGEMGGLRGELGAVTAREEEREDNSDRLDDRFHAVPVRRPKIASFISDRH